MRAGGRMSPGSLVSLAQAEVASRVEISHLELLGDVVGDTDVVQGASGLIVAARQGYLAQGLVRPSLVPALLAAPREAERALGEPARLLRPARPRERRREIVQPTRVIEDHGGRLRVGEGALEERQGPLHVTAERVSEREGSEHS